MHVKTLATSGIVSAAMLLSAALPALAAGPTTVVVTPTNTQGWTTADTNAGGTVTFVADATSPLPTGALQLTTDSTTAARAQYIHEAGVPLSSVTDLSYATKQVSGPPTADPSYQIAVDLNGAAAGGFTTLVYEPYWNGTVVPNVWQNWDVDAGQVWSSRTVTDGTCAVVSGAGGPPFYTLAGLQATCPDAQVLAFGVNIGTFNPNYVVETDAVNFNGTTYNFEQFQTATTKDDCKDGGYKNVTDAQGQPFKNQGQCVSYTNHI